MASPVVVVLCWEDCLHYKPIDTMMEDIKTAMRNVRPDLRFQIVKTPNKYLQFDVNVYPEDLRYYNSCSPMILLVPGSVWDKAIGQLGSDDPPQLRAGVQIMNGVHQNGSVQMLKYKWTHTTQQGREGWLREALVAPDFLAAQEQQ